MLFRGQHFLYGLWIENFLLKWIMLSVDNLFFSTIATNKLPSTKHQNNVIKISFLFLKNFSLFFSCFNAEVNDKKILREFLRKAIQNNNRRRFFAWQKLVNFMSFHELFKGGMCTWRFRIFFLEHKIRQGISFHSYLS